MKLYVWFEEDGRHYRTEIRYKRPRRYMCGWSYKDMCRYIKDEIEWQYFTMEQITSFEIENEKEHWLVHIDKQ